MINFDGILNEVRSKFSDREVYFSSAEIPTDLAVPSGWENFGAATTEHPSFPASWYLFAEELPWVLSLLEVGLLGTGILNGVKLELLYIFHDANGLYYYIGGQPLDSYSPRNNQAVPFQGKALEFYRRVHNGFTFFPAQSMGPQNVEDCSCVADLIDEEDTRFAEKWVTLFSNGAGDYLAMDLTKSAEGKGIIWWHEQPLEPELDVDVFKVMDTWISIFLEDTQPRDNIILPAAGFTA